MADDPKKVGSDDDIRINVGQKWELAYWKRKFTAMLKRNVTSADLRAAVKAEGTMAVDVLRYLKSAAG